ncbi:nucleotide-binding universal stress UspA family protein [Saccharopolyspora erythraea NRRL 2338]|uniref:Universal stress protein n=2 Tax=Saccharopolyspora erythraea TaxID=1836 RepID=A4FL85_SACEN|nr:universal stress protein [Saccharopolyspora erythraea]EQD85218.1 universal stress protein [Saccharopolyspora erythraea D]PFG98450.1 nucleotide-binding universal stress UspA family protein [Saccharopolyspora erythraea NRRL 2338]QRK88516.1 universal stress protein [Saccharopolyspora erythraea]CAM04810.1 putative universal stress protein [Saccharopolyspora erythraea NRRL 2338]
MAGKPQTVIAGIDGSEESGNALRWAAEYVQRVGGIVHAITVWSQPVQFGYRLPTPDAELETRARNSLETITEPVKAAYPDVDIRPRLVRGQIIDEFVGLTEQADLLVLGNKGHGAFTGMMVGSVALKLVHHAKCPVLVVR